MINKCHIALISDYSKGASIDVVIHRNNDQALQEQIKYSNVPYLRTVELILKYCLIFCEVSRKFAPRKCEVPPRYLTRVTKCS